jgi:hypothetical protein
MASFKDRLDRTWLIRLTAVELKKVKDEFKLNLAEWACKDNTLLERISNDPILLVDLLSCLLEDQIKQYGFNEHQFAEGIVGVGIENAANALVEALVNFSPPQRGRVIRAVWNKMTATEDWVTEKSLGNLEALDVQALLEAEMAEARKKLPMKSGAESSSSPE